MTDFLQDISGLADATSSRRDALRKGAGIGLAAAFASIPFLKPGRVMAQSTEGDFGILNYALTLEYLERSFYRQAIATGSIPSNVSSLFDTIENDETQHVLLLRGAINAAGGTPVQYTDSDFTFTPFLSSYANIRTLAQGLEDTGVRAYKGQAAAITSKDYLTVALQIHSVEARHAAAIRRLNGNQGWIPNAQPNAPEAIAPVYGAGSPASTFPSEANTTQGGINLVTGLSGYSAEEISEAFDEPLGMTTVLAIAGQFISGDEGDGDED
ncbi:ferritin-like domain-containing protein [Rubricoccus marinus]|uniref:Ferritin-like domain-containing protein n=1 Tax=Rubricoccus marinus TaxID=716817 RepID=A0A259U280_9BACT|nr:ferritin-like domain-containing protein [Rubricoccus marinus]OZC03914.1 hypothetical protein BSZ36_13545 [Rubricoccus marinus]